MYNVIFYSDSKGQRPVEYFLASLTKKAKIKMFKYIALLGEKKPSELSRDKHYKNLSYYPGLWEVRVDFGSNYYRIIYFYHVGDTIVLLHAFKKKTDETPPEELTIALKNKEDWQMRGQK
jgi:phage-related protein